MNNNFKQQQQSTLISNEKNVLLSNVPLNESILAISTSKNPRKYIQQDQVQKLAENKGCNGLTYSDIIIEFMCNQKQAQRTIKHFHRKGILFTNQDLIKEGINGLNLKNTSPQRYYATIIKAKVIEKFKEKYENALVKPTMDN